MYNIFVIQITICITVTNFLFPEYEFIIEQAIKLQIPFILKAFRSNCTAFIKNVNTTSLVKATEMSAKQMLIFQEKIMLAKEDLIYYFLRLNKICHLPIL